MSISKEAAKKLRQIYVDEHVTIFLRDMNVITVNEEDQEIKITAMREGYVIDVDMDFFYFGLPDGTITGHVSHELAQMVEITFNGDILDGDLPASEEEVH